jgi:hypothetical protein
MQFINKQSGEIHFAHNKADIKAYEANQAWEAVKEVVKAPKEEAPKEKKEKKSILDKIFKD